MAHLDDLDYEPAKEWTTFHGVTKGLEKVGVRTLFKNPEHGQIPMLNLDNESEIVQKAATYRPELAHFGFDSED